MALDPTVQDFDFPYPLAVSRFPTLRQSLLSSFDNCGLSAAFELEYRRGRSTHPQARGQTFHRFAAQCLRQMALLGEDSIPPDAALAIMRETIRQDDQDRVCPKCGTEDFTVPDSHGMRACANGHRFESNLVNLPLAMVRELTWVAAKWSNDNSFDVANLVDVELRLEATVHYPHRGTGAMVPRRLSGQLDALFIEGAEAESATVIDWKDTWGLPAAREEGDDELGPDAYFQQKTYACLIFKRFPSVQKVVLREFYPRYSETREATLWRHDEAEVESELAALAERFDRMMDAYLSLKAKTRDRMRATGKFPFPATPGKHCNFCARPGACPIPVFAREEGRITDAERAAELAHQLVVGEKVVKDARAALRAFADIHGPIPVRDAKGPRLLGYVPSVRVERPTVEDIERAVVENAGQPLTLEQMKALYKRRVGTRFQQYVPKPPEDPAAAEAELRAALEASIRGSDAA